MPPPAVEVDISQGTATVVITGELDALVAPTLSAYLTVVLAQPLQRLVFDLSGLYFLDCAAARLIAAAGQTLPPGRRPVIRGARPAVRRILQVSGLDAHCELEDRPAPWS
jgi:anti-anti-sigma factor